MFFPLHPQRIVRPFFLVPEISYFRSSAVNRLLIKHHPQYCRCTVGSEWARLFTVHDFVDRGSPVTFERIGGTRTARFNAAIWRDSPSVCALADDQRHLGHIVRAGNIWLAFDATHFSGTSSGFCLLGSWTNIALAKCAVELAIANECDRISKPH